MPIFRIKNRHRNKQLKILFASYECAPFFKLGGLGDVAGSLPKALKNLGADIRVVMPYYSSIKKNYPQIHARRLGLRSHFGEGGSFSVGGKKYKINIYQSNLPKSDVPIYFIDHKIFRAKNIFDQSERERFITFSLLIKKLLDDNSLDWQPDIIHCNDWQTAVVPLISKTKTLFTIHKIGYTGQTSLFILKKFGFAESDFNQIKNGSINLMRQAILDADLVSTVSPTYAQEILTKEYCYDMASILRQRKKDLYGIINGLDYEIFNQATDRNIKFKYDLKKINK